MVDNKISPAIIYRKDALWSEEEYKKKRLAVVGCGGIGSWVAFYAALMGYQNFILFDPDIVEPHNLNRTPFRMCDIGQPKVKAIEDIIHQIRPHADIIAIPEKLDEISLPLIEHATEIVVATDDSKAKKIVPDHAVIVTQDGTFIQLSEPKRWRAVWSAPQSEDRAEYSQDTHFIFSSMAGLMAVMYLQAMLPQEVYTAMATFGTVTISIHELVDLSLGAGGIPAYRLTLKPIPIKIEKGGDSDGGE